MGQSVLFGVLLQGKIEGVQQKLGALPLPALWQKAGQRHRKHLVFIGDGDTVHHTGGFKVIALADCRAGINQMPQPAGNTLCPQRGIGGKSLIVIGVTLDVGGVHRIQRVAQPGYIIKNAPDPAGYKFSVQSCASCFLEIVCLAVFLYGAEPGNAGAVDFGDLRR